MGDIGRVRREVYRFRKPSKTTPVPVPVPEPAKAPEPEKVPA